MTSSTERIAWSGGTLVDSHGARPGTLVTVDGRIEEEVDVSARLPHVDRVEVVGDGAFLLPAAIDVHCHFRVGDSPPREGFATGTRAALAGGIATVLEHPQASPTVVDSRTLKSKAQEAVGESALDFGLWVGAVPGNTAGIDDALSDGACGVKAFLCHGNPQFPPVAPEELAAAMEVAAHHGSVVAVHAEWQPTLDELQREVTTYSDWMASRPIRAEVEAVDVACRLAAQMKVRLHLVHLSSSGAVRRGLAWRNRGVDVTLETCPHYLFLDARDAQTLGPFAKCMPPLRMPGERQSLLKRLEQDIDIVGSDHAPHRLEDRVRGLRHYADAPAGLSTNQFMVPCVATVLARRLGVPAGLMKLAELIGSAPAQRFGLTDRGSLDAARLANFLVLAPKQTYVSSAELENRIRYTPLDGVVVDFEIAKVIIRGKIAFSAADGGVVGSPAAEWLRWPRELG